MIIDIFFLGYDVGMGMFGFSPLIWQYAVTAEVFPMNTFFAALLCYCTIRFARTHSFQVALLGAFLCGLALCNQHTIVLFQAPLILWIMWLLRRYIYHRPLSIIYLGIAFLCGLLPYIYLPTAALLKPSHGSWGHVTDMNGFLHHFLRKDYGTFQLYSGSAGKNTEGFSVRTLSYIKDVFYTQGYYVSLPLAAIGILMTILTTFAVLFESKPTVAAKQVGSSLRKKSNVSSTGTVQKKASKKETSKAVSKIHGSDDSDNNNDKDFGLVGDMSIHDFEMMMINANETVFTAIILVVVYIFYFCVFHSLANLPLGDKLLFGIHQRFWMQPNVLLFCFAGVGFNYCMYAVSYIVYFVYSSMVSGQRQGKQVNEEVEEIINSLPEEKKKRENAQLSAQLSSRSSNSISSSFSISSLFYLGRTFVGISISCLFIINQHDKWYFASDQSDAYSFKRYSSAILDPLPTNSVLLVNYDMLWTSVRYIQECEGFRKDITSINLSMMTYEWFKHKRKSLKKIKFPGEYHAAAGSNKVKMRKAFTIKQLLDANYGKIRWFLGGRLSFKDHDFEQHYELQPTGLAAEFKMLNRLPNATTYMKSNAIHWKKVMNILPELPSVIKYPEETWEWTIGRDFKDRVAEAGASLLELAIAHVDKDIQPLISAVYFLESAIQMELRSAAEANITDLDIGNNGQPVLPTALLKNAGLGQVYLMKSNKMDSLKILPAVTVTITYKNGFSVSYGDEAFFEMEQTIINGLPRLRENLFQTAKQEGIVTSSSSSSTSKSVDWNKLIASGAPEMLRSNQHPHTFILVGVTKEAIESTSKVKKSLQKAIAEAMGVHMKYIDQPIIKSLSFLPLPHKGDIFHTTAAMNWPSEPSSVDTDSWIKWSAKKFLFEWGQYLRRDDAKLDPQYDTIKSTYDTMSKFAGSIS